MDVKTEPVDELISFTTVEIAYADGLKPDTVKNACLSIDVNRHNARIKQEQIHIDEPNEDKNSKNALKFDAINSTDKPKRITKPSTSKKRTNCKIKPRPTELTRLSVDKMADEYPSTVNNAIGNYLDEVWNTVERRKADDEKDPRSHAWKRNRIIKAREIGDRYESVERKKNDGGIIGKTVLREARVLKPRCDSLRCGSSKAARQCTTVSEEDRRGIFNSFWQHMTWEQRKLYVNALVERTSTKRICDDINTSRRGNTFKYFLDINFQRVPVCKRMFLSTLSLGEWTVLSWVKKANLPTKNVDRVNKKNVLKLEHVTCFLRTLPKSQFYDSDESSTKDYLELSYRTIRDVYRAFEKYFSDSGRPLDERGGYNMFRKQMELMNLAIFQPRKE